LAHNHHSPNRYLTGIAGRYGLFECLSHPMRIIEGV
jgi:hypothetical protein